MDKNKYNFYFLVHGSNQCVYEEEIKKYYNEEVHIFFFESIKKHFIKTYKKLKEFYKNYGNKFDIIHLQTGATSEVMYIYPFCKKMKAKIIIHSHNGNGYSPIINKLFQPLVNKISDKKLSCSNEASKWLFNSTDTTIINNGIDTKRFTYSKIGRNKIREKHGIKDSDFVIGHIGRFSEQKNHEFIIKIFKKICSKNRKAKLLLVGVGEKEEKIKQMANNNNLNDKIIFAGKQSNTEDYYSSFDLFIMPSLYEGLPIVGIEAQCSGLDCIFSNNIDDQIIITNKAKMLELDEDKWIKEINKIINSERNIDKRNKYEKNIVNSGFSLNNTIKQLGEIYDEISKK